MNNPYMYAGGMLLLAYFLMFYLVMRQAGKDAVAKYTSMFSNQKIHNLLGIMPMAVSFFIKVNVYAVSLFVCAISVTTIFSIIQYRQMKNSGFETSFSNRLLAVSIFGCFAISVLFCSRYQP